DTKKIQAAVAVAVMLAAGAFVLAYAPDESDAAAGTWTDPIDSGTMVLKASTSTSDGGIGYATFKVNESAFSGYSGSSAWVAYVSATKLETEDPTGTSGLTDSTETDVAPYKLTMTAQTDNTGEYSLKVQADSTTASSNYLYLQYTVKFTVNEVEFTQSLVYCIAVEITLSGIGELGITTDDITGTFGENLNVDPGYTINEVSLTGDYTYYALNLPAGLSMNATTGYISGMPSPATATEKVEATVTVFVTDSDGNVYQGSLTVTINPASSETSTLTYEVKMDGVVQDDYVFQTGTAVTLEVSIDGSLTSVTSVTAVDEDGNYEALAPSDVGKYTITSDGTGAYRVTMTNIDDSTGVVSDSFYIYFYDDLADVEAKIVVSGS
ncbi:MAG: putative Ig domain-containing protein, partial [Thermoplasmata archaeon]|nr:putative Ig domain-containing protein [Thermoplasmata archaeon]